MDSAKINFLLNNGINSIQNEKLQTFIGKTLGINARRIRFKIDLWGKNRLLEIGLNNIGE
jgi:hypothetical protein